MLSRPCFNLAELPELDQRIGKKIPSVMTIPGIIPEFDEFDSPRSKQIVQRRIIVANQLPIKAFKHDQQWRFEYDEDSLYFQLKDGLDPNIDFLYIGCLRVEIELEEQEKISQILFDEFKCLPVFLPNDVNDKYYHGFCKHYLWPLFHYKMPIPCNLGCYGYDPTHWSAYISANIVFAHKVIEILRFRGEDDYIWVNDYHLMLLPTLLRRRVFRVKIGFFMHNTFPSSEIFRAIPVREEILRGLLNADLIGFHTFDYARHFLSCCSRMLGLDYKSKRGYLGVEYYGRTVSIKILPVGIHMGQLKSLMSSDETMKRVMELKAKYEGKTVIVGVDDMDVLKGITFKFLALKHLLKTQPLLRGELVLVQIANPARSQGEDVLALQREIDHIVKETNEKYGQPGYEPIVFINENVSTLEKAAHYAISECCVLNCLRDGMNLVPYKYTVCRQASPILGEGKRSVIIVSEFVGCSPSLSGAIRVNPWNVEQLAESMHNAIIMSDMEKHLRHEKHYKYISSHDIGYWARSFDQDLLRACGDHFSKRCWGVGFGLKFRVVALPPDFRKLSVDCIKAAYDNTSSRLILLDYDGTMTSSALVDEAPSSNVISILSSLCNDPRNTVFIVSGRDREGLGKWFSPCEKLGLSAEHGYFTRWNNSSPWESSMQGADFDWKKIVIPIMESYAEATDGSFIEQKETALVWHYQDSSYEFGVTQSKELLDHLENVLANEPVDVKRGKHIVEVKPQGVSKGIAVEKLIATMRNEGKAPDFVLCIGDDRSDEDMFEGIGRATSDPSSPTNPQIFACTVGQKPSMAKYYLEDADEVIALVKGLAGVPSTLQEPKPEHTFDT
ncbi:putative alpha,alpha-trehalose-phosphate synthase [UDP-forming] 11 [Silene latifolia]|uniref:putative alpha,alpha-trehalose-phosphate synthase [UDP-forming] 11 n=1 Tax=Silene latifolia TaxID=37657 RepID=UPI003D77D98F